MPWRAAITGRASLCAGPAAPGGLLQACRAAAAALPPLASPPALPGQAVRGRQLEGEVPLRPDDAAERVLGRHGRWLLQVAEAAHARAGLAALPREQVGLCVALGMVDPDPEDLAPAVLASREGGEGHAGDGPVSLARFHAGGFRAMHPLWPLSMLGNVAAGQVAIALDLRGDNTVLASDGLSGVRVLLEARRALQAGAAQAVLAAAAAEPLAPASLARLSLAGEAGAWREPGEGAAALVLEQPAAAAARAAPVAGWLVGAATRAARPGEAAGPLLARVAAEALAEAGWEARDVGLLLLAGRARDADVAGLCAQAERLRPAACVGDLLGAAPLLASALALEAGVPRALVVHAEGERAAGALALEVAACGS
ncbi:MAG: beta-ketoacyl synthase N-terminal-like domain-containing protein [Planctomycetia bacterium]